MRVPAADAWIAALRTAHAGKAAGLLDGGERMVAIFDGIAPPSGRPSGSTSDEDEAEIER